MKLKKISNNEYLIRLVSGEEIIESLQKFHNVYADEKLCKLEAIGAISSPTLGYLKESEYVFKSFEGNYEVVSCLGSITLKDGNSIPHIHLTVSDINYNVFGGHLINAVVTATLEVFVTVYDTTIERKLDKEIGLPLMEL